MNHQVDSALGLQGAGVFFEKDIEHVIPRLLEEKRAPLNGLRLFDVDDSVPSGSDTFVQRIYDSVGEAEFIEDFGGDLPLVGASARENPGMIRFFGSAFKVTIKDMRQAMIATRGGANPQLPTRLARSAVRSVEEFHNKCIFGRKEGLPGIFSPALKIPRVQIKIELDRPPTGGKTKADQLAALNALVNGVDERSGQTFKGRRALLPPAVYSYISTTPWSDSAGDTTILTFWLENNPDLQEVEKVGECVDATGKGRIFVYQPDPDVIRYVAPTILEQLPPQWRNLAYTTPVFGEAGGMASEFPAGAAIGELTK